MTRRLDTDEFAAQVAAPLKERVTLDAAFEARVMRAVAEAAAPWWQRRRTFTLAPSGMLAAAAGLALMIAGAFAVARQTGTTVPQVAAAADTVFVVRFVLADPTARSVALVGDFNGWSRTATLLEPTEVDGQWTVSLTLPSGRHEYAFIVDGERWTADPHAVATRDEFGAESSIVRVGSSQAGS